MLLSSEESPRIRAKDFPAPHSPLMRHMKHCELLLPYILKCVQQLNSAEMLLEESRGRVCDMQLAEELAELHYGSLQNLITSQHVLICITDSSGCFSHLHASGPTHHCSVVQCGQPAAAAAADHPESTSDPTSPLLTHLPPLQRDEIQTSCWRGAEPLTLRV